MTFVSNTFAIALASFTVALGALTIAGVGFAPSADAEPAQTFKVAFKYNSANPAEMTYASINEQAAAACRHEVRPDDSLASQHRWMKTCREDLVGKAVMAIGKPELVALHNGANPGRQIAGQ